MSFELPRPPENLAKLTEDAAKKARAALNEKVAKDNFERVEKNALTLTLQPQQRYNVMFRQSCDRLRAISAMTEQNRKIFTAGNPSPSAVLQTVTSEMTPAGERRIDKILEALQASPPQPPANINEDIETLPNSDPASRYLTINRDRGRGDEPRLFYASVNPQIHEDIRYANALLQPYLNEENQSPQRARQRQALQTLIARLTAYAQQDLFRYQSYLEQQQQDNSVTSRGFATMGKFVAVLGLLTYALADGAMAFAHRRMPTGALIGMLGAAVIADRRLRNQFLLPAEQIVADEVNVINSPGFQRLAKIHGFYTNATWVEVIRTIMTNSNSSATDTFLAKVKNGRATAEEIRDFAGDLAGGNAEVRAKIILMLGTRNSDGVSDFEALRIMLVGKSRDAQQGIIAIMESRRRILPPVVPVPPLPGTTV